MEREIEIKTWRDGEGDTERGTDEQVGRGIERERWQRQREGFQIWAFLGT